MLKLDTRHSFGQQVEHSGYADLADLPSFEEEIRYVYTASTGLQGQLSFCHASESARSSS